MSQTQVDGQNHGQAASAAEDGDQGGEASPKVDRLEQMEARFDLLNDSLTELRQAILDGRRQAATPQIDDIDDDEPLTRSSLKKIVQSSVANASAVNHSLNERTKWDDKAKSEFPLSDPKFLREFKAEWREMTNSGLDPNHPRAVYKVAQAVARNQGGKSKPTTSAETTQTSEASTSSQTQRPSRQSSAQGAVKDDDPRLKFYNMKGDRTKAQVDAMRQKLSEKDAKRRAK